MISLRVSKRSTLQQRINLSNHSSGPKSNSNHIAISISFFLFGLSRDHKQLLLRSAVVARSELPFTFSQTLIIIAGETKLLLFFLPFPLQIDDAAIQVYKDGDYGAYLDLESSLAEQAEEIEGVNVR